MKPIAQEHPFGRGVACVAFVLSTSYQCSLKLFNAGKNKVNTKGFLCREIVNILNNAGLNYHYKYVSSKIREKIYTSRTIVFIKRSKKYPAGHYLVRKNNKWMDPWINFPHKNIKAGFRARLPGRPIYAILCG